MSTHDADRLAGFDDRLLRRDDALYLLFEPTLELPVWERLLPLLVVPLPCAVDEPGVEYPFTEDPLAASATPPKPGAPGPLEESARNGRYGDGTRPSPVNGSWIICS